jgi:RNA polymerase sigma-70 factor (ECF subfamily)
MDDSTDAMALAELLDERRHLLDVAGWMLGSRSESERVVDETYGRWYELSDAAREDIGAPRSWLAKVAGGICLAQLAQPPRGEDAGGTESRAEGATPRPADDGAQRTGATAPTTPTAPTGTVDQQVTQVLLSAVGSLSPAELTAFGFSGVKAMPSATAAGFAGPTGPERGAPADRVRTHLRTWRSRPSAQAHDAVVGTVRLACETEDEELLTSVLAVDATALFDGGGKVRALVRPVHGRDKVARSLLTLMGRRARAALAIQSVNGRTGIVARYHNIVAAVIRFDITDDRVTQIWVTLNPDKLRSWNRSGRQL